MYVPLRTRTSRQHYFHHHLTLVVSRTNVRTHASTVETAPTSDCSCQYLHLCPVSGPSTTTVITTDSSHSLLTADSRRANSPKDPHTISHLTSRTHHLCSLITRRLLRLTLRVDTARPTKRTVWSPSVPSPAAIIDRMNRSGPAGRYLVFHRRGANVWKHFSQASRVTVRTCFSPSSTGR